jgi:hypothetical protein
MLKRTTIDGKEITFKVVLEYVFEGEDWYEGYVSCPFCCDEGCLYPQEPDNESYGVCGYDAHTGVSPLKTIEEGAK